MKCRTLLAAALVLATSLTAFADAKDDLAAAVKKTADATSYAWTATTQGGFGAGETKGKFEKDNAIHVTIPSRDTSFEIFSKGKKAAIKTEEGWKSAAELTAGEAQGFDPARMIATQAIDYKTPTATLADMLPKIENIKAETDGFSGALSEAGAKELLAVRRGGRGGPAGANAPAPETKNAKATVRFWTKDGAVSKMELHVSGSMSFNGQDRDIDRTTTTEIKEVGATKVTIPEEAKKKLDA